VNNALSAEALVMQRPMATYRQLAQQTATGSWWIGLRRPLCCACLLGCALSLVVSNRLTLRLIAGGAVAWSFIPLFEVASFAAVRQRRRRAASFSRDVDLFFTGHGPWAVGLIGVAAVASFLTPLQVYAWAGTTTSLISLAGVGGAIAIWSAYIDFCFYRAVFESTPPAAVRQLLLQRAIGWTVALTYYFGYAAWPLVADWVGL
jgi:hypothetical protein